MKHSYSAGAVIINNGGQVLLVNEGRTFWGFPKGHIEVGEDAITAAKREANEEAGIDNLIHISKLGTYTRHPYNYGVEDKTELKHITMLLFKASQKPTRENLENYQVEWVNSENVAHLLTHPKDKQFFIANASKIKLNNT